MDLAGGAIFDLAEGGVDGAGGGDAEVGDWVVGGAEELGFGDFGELEELLEFLVGAELFHCKRLIYLFLVG